MNIAAPADVGHESIGPVRPVALVTGASRGIGKACAESLAASGHDLLLCARNANGLEELSSDLQAAGACVHVLQADVGSARDLLSVFEELDRRFGRIDVLVANTGGPSPGRFSDLTDQQWEAAFQATFMSVTRSIRQALDRMVARRHGRIVVIGSSSIRESIPGLTLSNALRPAIAGLVKSTAQEVAKLGITINVVAPGRIDTDRLKEIDERLAADDGVSYSERRSSVERSIPVGRYGTSHEAAALVGFLASDEASYVTGQCILIDGGLVPSLP